MTTRDNGTGLGLAIVMRIVADHGGNLTLHDRDNGQQGAVIEFDLPIGAIDPTLLDGVNTDDKASEGLS